MRLLIVCMGLAWIVGCSRSTDTAITPPIVSETEDSVAVDTQDGDVWQEIQTSDNATGTEVILSAENTLIQFVGTHAVPPPDPKARTGKFDDFNGKALIEEDELKSVVVDIQMASLSTPIENLTNHLQGEEFLGVREYPTARFESTSIARHEDGDHIITGDLTLHGETKEISFMADVGMPDGELNLSAKLKIDRTEFGMTQNIEKVNKEVELTIVVGQATKAKDADAQASL